MEKQRYVETERLGHGETERDNGRMGETASVTLFCPISR